MTKLKPIIPLCSLVFALLGAVSVRAQEGADPTDEIENLFSEEEQKPVNVPAEAAPKKTDKDEIKDISSMGKLSEFSDIAVIQKRFLPKTKRFELYTAGSLLTNDPFFLNFGLNLRLAYYFRERFGAEFVGYALTTSEREVTKDLLTKRGVKTSTIVTPKDYYGIDFKWVPVYGKQTWMNHKITPLDLYFSLGAGITQTNQGTGVATLHLGTGQAFAMSKGSAFRWDFSWNAFTAKSSANSSASSLYNNLFLSFGFSFFFPGATYR
jgi:outer membrane beta-barrel protein